MTKKIFTSHIEGKSDSMIIFKYDKNTDMKQNQLDNIFDNTCFDGKVNSFLF